MAWDEKLSAWRRNRRALTRVVTRHRDGPRLGQRRCGGCAVIRSLAGDCFAIELRFHTVSEGLAEGRLGWTSNVTGHGPFASVAMWLNCDQTSGVDSSCLANVFCGAW